MDDSLKHIDELFRSHLGSAGVTPPTGVFEQCVEQLHASGTEGQGLNQGAIQQSVESGLENAAASAGKTIFGISMKASVAILGSVVAAVFVISAILNSKASVDNVNHVSAGIPSAVEVEKNSDQTEVGFDDNSDKTGASSAMTNTEIGNSRLDADARTTDLDKSSDVAGYGGTIPVAHKNHVGLGNSGVVKIASRIENSSNAAADKSTITTSVDGSGDKSNQAPRLQKLTAANASPCQTYGNQWKPVIADIVGGIVSLGIEGKYEKMRVDWADGERSEVLTDQVGVERVSHQYWVANNRTFNVKMLNERRVFDEKGMWIVCRDSQRVAVSIAPVGDATDIFVPDIFTPNGDGFNEEFYIRMAQPQMFDICVFDVNNRLIFRSENYDARWKGICGASVCPEGVYRVVVSYKYSGDKSLKYARKSVKLIYKANQ